MTKQIPIASDLGSRRQTLTWINFDLNQNHDDCIFSGESSVNASSVLNVHVFLTAPSTQILMHDQA
jgi:hypothetical protein